MAVGKAGEPADRDRLSIRFGTTQVAREGLAVEGYDEAPVAAHLKGQEIDIGVDLGLGDGRVLHQRQPALAAHRPSGTLDADALRVLHVDTVQMLHDEGDHFKGHTRCVRVLGLLLEASSRLARSIAAVPVVPPGGFSTFAYGLRILNGRMVKINNFHYTGDNAGYGIVGAVEESDAR